MTDSNDWNAKIIAEFRANNGHVGPPFEGAPLTLTDIEVGAETFPVSVTELTGAERDTVYAEHARRYPRFGEYSEMTEGIRTIPVLELRRA